MTLVFYAPMKPPDHPVPSGDRTIAQGLIAALHDGGADVVVASRLQTRDGQGDTDVQDQLFATAAAEADRVIDAGHAADWQAWITYHNYYKTPDLIGPKVARSLGIPYLQIESTRARKRLTGPWHRFAAAAEAAADAADAVFYFSMRDSEALRRDATEGQKLIHLRPFLPQKVLPSASTLEGPMLSVGMMRAGDKLASYQIIANALAVLQTTDWRLTIVGDGPARQQVEALMAPFGARVSFRGQLTPQALATEYAQAALMFWPGVNEALGQVYLEAQAAGVPVVAQDRPGMRELLGPGVYPQPEDGPEALATCIDTLLSRPQTLRTSAKQARAHVTQYHLLGAARATLITGLNAVGVRV